MAFICMVVENKINRDDTPRIINAKIYVSKHRRDRKFTELPRKLVGDPFVCPRPYCDDTLEDITSEIIAAELPDSLNGVEIKYGICCRCRTNNRHFMEVGMRPSVNHIEKRGSRFIEEDTPKLDIERIRHPNDY